MEIVSVGECTRDRHVDRGVELVGGISLNFAVQARRSGAARVALVSCTGSDGWGVQVHETLARAGVDATHVHQLPGPSASQVIRMEHGGERSFPMGGYDAGVLSRLQLDHADHDFVGSFGIVVSPYFTQVAHLFHAAMRAARPGALKVTDALDGIDLGPDLEHAGKLLKMVDVMFISGDDHTVHLLQPLAEASGGLIVVTHGPGGSTALTGGVRHVQQALHVPTDEVQDTTGCGDAFQAAFIVEYVTSHDIPSALKAGARRAAQVIRHVGGVGPGGGAFT